jgi:voltage-gated sodium channel
MAAIAAAMGANAASRAYKAECKKERTFALSLPRSNIENLWLVEFAERLPVEDEDLSLLDRSNLGDDGHSKVYTAKEAELAGSKDRYDQVAWWVYSKLTSRPWFEAFVMFNILLIGISTGVDLETNGGAGSPGIQLFIELTASLTFVVFSVECVLKLIAESWHVERYFQDPENGAFNSFDFLIVLAGFAFLGSDSGGAIGALRLLRLVRLLTFVKGVPQLRGIIVGLVIGMKSVVYILVLLFLVIYLFAIIGVLFLGSNDTARFGTVTTAMLHLFQVSTKASWTNIAYTSWWGCGNFEGDPYTSANQLTGRSRAVTSMGDFQGYKCDEAVVVKNPLATGIFFALFILVTAWVVMSLFIGVISIGMFEAFEAMRAERQADDYVKRIKTTTAKRAASVASMAGPHNTALDADTGETVQFKSLRKATNPLAERPELSALVDFALADEMEDPPEPSQFYERLRDVARQCQVKRDKHDFLAPAELPRSNLLFPLSTFHMQRTATHNCLTCILFCGAGDSNCRLVQQPCYGDHHRGWRHDRRGHRCPHGVRAVYASRAGRDQPELHRVAALRGIGVHGAGHFHGRAVR